MARVRALERAIGLLDEKIEECEEPELLMRLLEQQRKHLQAVAQERGEWNKPEEDDKVSAANILVERMLQAELRRSPVALALSEPVIEGESRELGASTG